MILTCGPRDFHTLGLESMGVLLANRGYGCRVLGARTPVKSLAAAVQGTGAAGLVMVSHLSIGRRSAIEALRSIQHTTPSCSTPATPSFAAVPQGRARHLPGRGPVAAANLITSSLASARGAP